MQECFFRVTSQTGVVQPQLWDKVSGEVCDQDQTELGGGVRCSNVHNVQKLVPRKNCLLNLLWISSLRELKPKCEVAHVNMQDLPSPWLVQVAVTCTLALGWDRCGARCGTRMDHVPAGAQIMAPCFTGVLSPKIFLIHLCYKTLLVYLKPIKLMSA